MEIPTGTRMTYVAEYDSTRPLTLQTADLITAVTSDLSKENIVVEHSSISNNWSDAVATYTLKLLINDLGHASEIDVQKIVDRAFGLEAGVIDYYPPSSSRISDITLPGGTSTPTGAPPAPDPTGDSDNPKSLIDQIFSALGLDSAGTGIGIGLLVGGAIVVGGLFLLGALEAKA